MNHHTESVNQFDSSPFSVTPPSVCALRGRPMPEAPFVCVALHSPTTKAPDSEFSAESEAFRVVDVKGLEPLTFRV